MRAAHIRALHNRSNRNRQTSDLKAVTTAAPKIMLLKCIFSISQHACALSISLPISLCLSVSPTPFHFCFIILLGLAFATLFQSCVQPFSALVCQNVVGIIKRHTLRIRNVILLWMCAPN